LANDSTQNIGANDDELSAYFAGTRIYGDDFSAEDIAAWYRDEQHAYYDIATATRPTGFYDYHALNQAHGFGYLPSGCLGKVLSFGGANGEEVRPIAARAASIVIVEPADYDVRTLDGTAVEYRKPAASGVLPARDGEFDVAICLGALHHIPNVTFVIQEIARVVRDDGIALIREPVVSMGDWRRPRPGLTRRERGLPATLFESALRHAGFEVIRCTRCVHPITPRIGRLLHVNWFNSFALTRLDYALSRIHPFPTVYHPNKWWQRIQPSAVFYVLRRSKRRHLSQAVDVSGSGSQ